MTEHKLKIGDKLPHFILNNENHQPIDISALKGQFLVLYFYPKDDTKGCIREACSFRDSFNKLLEAGALVYGVSSDRPVTHARFKAKYQLPFSLLSDTAGELRITAGCSVRYFWLAAWPCHLYFQSGRSPYKGI